MWRKPTGTVLGTISVVLFASFWLTLLFAANTVDRLLGHHSLDLALVLVLVSGVFSFAAGGLASNWWYLLLIPLMATMFFLVYAGMR